MTMKKPQTPEELGVPVARNGSVSGLKSQNGYAPPKPPLGSPSPKPCKTPPHVPTVLDEPGKKVKKPAPLQHFSPPLKTSPGPPGAGELGGSRCEGRRPGSWDGRATLSTSPRPPAARTANGLGPKVGDEGPAAERRASSPEHPAGGGPARPPPAPQSGAAPPGDSQGTHSAGPAKVLPAREDAELVKAKCPDLSSASPEPANTMSPPPAKKLALSARKVGVWEGVGRGWGAGSIVVWGVGRQHRGIWPPEELRRWASLGGRGLSRRRQVVASLSLDEASGR